MRYSHTHQTFHLVAMTITMLFAPNVVIRLFGNLLNGWVKNNTYEKHTSNEEIYEKACHICLTYHGCYYWPLCLVDRRLLCEKKKKFVKCVSPHFVVAIVAVAVVESKFVFSLATITTHSSHQHRIHTKHTVDGRLHISAAACKLFYYYFL